jgi:hypothetical protein
MIKVSPKVLTLALAAVCTLSTQSANAASLNPGSLLQITGLVQVASSSSASPGDTLLFYRKDPVTFLNTTPAPLGSYGNYSVQLGTSSFAALTNTPNSADYEVASIKMSTPQTTTNPFLKVGLISGVGDVDFFLSSVSYNFTPAGIPGFSNLTVSGLGTFRIDGTNANVGQGSFSTQFLNLSNLPADRSFSGTQLVLEVVEVVVPEPSEVLGLLSISAGGVLTLLRRRRLVSASK